MVTRLVSVVIAVASIAAFALLTQPTPQKADAIGLSNVQTNQAVDFGVEPKFARCYFVEMVLPDREQLQQAVAVFGRTLRPTPPPHYVWLQKRTHPSGEGFLAMR
jgi:TPP-dependent trihydroxycyclohexane-1,2-dione (THcHDO) dehydratase